MSMQPCYRSSGYFSLITSLVLHRRVHHVTPQNTFYVPLFGLARLEIPLVSFAGLANDAASRPKLSRL